MRVPLVPVADRSDVFDAADVLIGSTCGLTSAWIPYIPDEATAAIEDWKKRVQPGLEAFQQGLALCAKKEIAATAAVVDDCEKEVKGMLGKLIGRNHSWRKLKDEMDLCDVQSAYLWTDLINYLYAQLSVDLKSSCKRLQEVEACITIPLDLSSACPDGSAVHIPLPWWMQKGLISSTAAVLVANVINPRDKGYHLRCQPVGGEEFEDFGKNSSVIIHLQEQRKDWEMVRKDYPYMYITGSAQIRLRCCNNSNNSANAGAEEPAAYSTYILVHPPKGLGISFIVSGDGERICWLIPTRPDLGPLQLSDELWEAICGPNTKPGVRYARIAYDGRNVDVHYPDVNGKKSEASYQLRCHLTPQGTLTTAAGDASGRTTPLTSEGFEDDNTTALMTSTLTTTNETVAATELEADRFLATARQQQQEGGEESNDFPFDESALLLALCQDDSDTTEVLGWVRSYGSAADLRAVLRSLEGHLDVSALGPKSVWLRQSPDFATSRKLGAIIWAPEGFVYRLAIPTPETTTAIGRRRGPAAYGLRGPTKNNSTSRPPSSEEVRDEGMRS